MKKLQILMIALITALVLMPAVSAAQEEEEVDDCTAYVAGITGTAEFRVSEDEEWAALELDMCLMVGDMIRTKEKSGLALKFGEAVEVKVNESSELTVGAIEEDGEQPNRVDVEVGELWSDLDKEQNEDLEFQVGTPSGVVAVRGTEFNVAVDKEGKSKINVLDGVVSVFNDLGEVLAEAGMATELIEGKLPVEPFEFDVEQFKNKLDAWKDQISIGKIKEAMTEKVEEAKEEAKENVKDKIKGRFGF